jgi:hypothetical protein
MHSWVSSSRFGGIQKEAGLKIWFLPLAVLSLCLGATSAIAQNDIYDNGPTDGQTYAWTIDFGFAVSDTFSLSSASQVNGITFAAWLVGSDVLQTTEVAITSSEFGGTSYFDQTVSFTQSGCVLNQDSFNVCTEKGSFGTNVNLAAGTYWLTLENADTNTLNDPVYWDQNSGPSLASENAEGTIPSESFTIEGSSASSTGSTPEPGSLVLSASGALAAFASIRRKYRR